MSIVQLHHRGLQPATVDLPANRRFRPESALSSLRLKSTVEGVECISRPRDSSEKQLIAVIIEDSGEVSIYGGHATC